MLMIDHLQNLKQKVIIIPSQPENKQNMENYVTQFDSAKREMVKFLKIIY